MTSGVYDCIASANEVLAAHSALVSRVRATQWSHRRQLRTLASPPHAILKLPLISSPTRSPSPSPPSSPVTPPKPRPQRPDLPPAKRARSARYSNYIPEEETIRNDYSQRYVDGGEWPQNWVLGADPEHRFEEYPKQQRLLALKKASVAQHSLPPVFLPYAHLSTLHPSKFDVILIDPPFSSSFTWDNLQELPIPALAADPSFVFMWVGSGSGEGLERGREVMARWGFRRCEDIVWVKTNKTSNHGPGTDPPTTSLLTRTKQHCLMGIRGTVRRSTDSWFVHCNVDTDVMIWEGHPSDPTLKPPEMYTLIENFCLGLRRLEIFGRAQTARRGWVTALAEGEEDRIEEGMVLDDADGADPHQGAMKWDREAWEARIKELANGGKAVVPMTQEIDALRPKSPVRGGSNNMNAGMGSSLPANPAQMGIVMPLGMGMAGHSGNANPNRAGFQNANRMVQPMMAMANMGAGDVSMMGWPEMGMNMVGMNMGTPMGGLPGMNAMGMGVGQQGMGFTQGAGGFGGFDGGQMHGGMGMDPNMGWMPGVDGQMWDGGMGEGMMGMSGMGNMGMGVNMGMGGNMNANMGMGMGMGQWGGEGPY
ncbi:MT-A70-domain-containing protein [Obba rivulosa]|uniref:MT-A70-domain-containing protein n=1 Tax=Obba rivulosa TaxID=1052685 RepID=A0A8E2AV81_9APHY|nr:MT-A70-domain-containing protein [Obba rivulosa]